MKTKLLIVLMAAALMLTISGTTQALTVQAGPGILKTWNHEIGTTYMGGTPMKFYYRTNTTSYDTVELGKKSFADADTGGLISTLPSLRNANLRDDDPTTPGVDEGEDTFGLLLLRTLGTAHVGIVDSRFGDGSDATEWGNDIIEDAGGGYWDYGDNDEYVRGAF